MLSNCFRALQILVATLDDEARHPKLAAMNRRAFASLVSVIAIPGLLRANEPDPPSSPSLIGCKCVNGDCDTSEGYQPDPSAGCSNFCGGPVTCPTAHCWCVPHTGVNAGHAQEHLAPGTIDLTIGDVEGAEKYLFGWIRGLEFDAYGRIYVADGDVGDVRVFDAQGHHLFKVSGRGGGPGEFRQSPCNITLSQHGQLWVADGDLRWNRYVVDRSGAVSERAVPSPEGYRGRCKRLAFPAAEEFITELVRDGEGESEEEYVFARLDFLGRLLQSWPVRIGGTLEEFGWASVTFRRGQAPDATILFPPPFPRRSVWASSPNGGYARADTQRFRVEVYGVGGVLVRTVERSVPAPPVTAEERRQQEVQLDSLRRQFVPLGGYPDFTVPDTKPPVQGLWFDADGRLWVMVNTVGIGGDNQAQVFSGVGDYLFTATWPDRVSLGHGAIRGDTAVGVQLGEFDIQRVVRIRFDIP